MGGHSNSNQKRKCVTGVTRNGVHHFIRNINTPTVLNMRGEYILEDENHNEVKYLPQRYLALPTKNEK